MNYREVMDKSFQQLVDSNALGKAKENNEDWERAVETAKNLFSCGMSAMHKQMAQALKDSNSLEEYVLACNEIAVDILRFSGRFSEQEIQELVDLHTEQKRIRNSAMLQEALKGVIKDLKSKLDEQHKNGDPPTGKCPNSKE